MLNSDITLIQRNLLVLRDEKRNFLAISNMKRLQRCFKNTTVSYKNRTTICQGWLSFKKPTRKNQKPSKKSKNPAKTQKPSEKPRKTLGFSKKPTTHGFYTKNPGFLPTLTICLVLLEQ